MNTWSSSRRRNTMERLWEAQGKACFLCGAKMVPVHRDDINRGWSLDHVYPRGAGFHHSGNLLVAHKSCNRKKADRAPTPCELLLLKVVNDRLGLELRMRLPNSTQKQVETA